MSEVKKKQKKQKNRQTGEETREHADYIHKGVRDNWTQVQHIRVGQIIAKAGKWTKGGGKE